MPLYHVTWMNKSTETYEIEAADADEAEERFTEGRLIASRDGGEVDLIQEVMP